MKAQTRRVRAGKISGFKFKRLRNVLNARSEPYLKLLEGANELLTDADMMRIFRVNRVTLYRWRKKGILPCVKFGRSIYYVKPIICKILLAQSGYSSEG